MDAQLYVKKKISQCNGTRILPGNWRSTVREFRLYIHIYIYDFLVLFYLHKISTRQTRHVL